MGTKRNQAKKPLHPNIRWQDGSRISQQTYDKLQRWSRQPADMVIGSAEGGPISRSKASLEQGLKHSRRNISRVSRLNTRFSRKVGF